MQEVEVIRRFDAPPQAVWDVYTDHARWSEWAGLGRSKLEREGSPDRNGTGALRALGPPILPAREEILASGGSLSHHHGVGKLRKDFMGEVFSETALRWKDATKKAMDPANVFGCANNEWSGETEDGEKGSGPSSLNS